MTKDLRLKLVLNIILNKIHKKIVLVFYNENTFKIMRGLPQIFSFFNYTYMK